MFLDAEYVGHDFSSCELVIEPYYNDFFPSQILFSFFDLIILPYWPINGYVNNPRVAFLSRLR